MMARRVQIRALGALVLVVGLGCRVAAGQSGQAIKVGGMCDRTGPTRVIGTELCPGVADYIALVNKKGGVLGHKLEYTELEHGYMVPRAVEAYEQLKRDGAVTFFTYGVPTLLGLAPHCMEDNLPPFNPGTGRSYFIDGMTWPYIFP